MPDNRKSLDGTDGSVLAPVAFRLQNPPVAMHRSVLLLALLAPTASLAATAAGSVVVTDTNAPTNQVNLDECTGAKGDSLSLSWTVSPTVTPVSGWKFHVMASSVDGCPDSDAKRFTVADVALDSTLSLSGTYPPTGTTLDASVTISQVGIICQGTPNLFFCVQLQDASGAAVTNNPTAKGSIAVDAVVPPAPSGVTVSAGDGALTVGWTAGSGSVSDGGTSSGSSASYMAQATSVSDPNDVHQQTTTSNTVRITGLTNNQSYGVVVYAYSAAGNESQPSAPVLGTPLPVNDFWKDYQARGGKETGGCAAGGAGALALLSVAALAGRRRSRR